jgi:chromosomal replication initiation ATPase DnaA
VKPMTEQAAEAAIRVACRELHLPTIAAEAPRIADDATRERLTHRGFLAEVLAAEVDERAQRRKARRLLEAHFPRLKRLEDFDTTVTSGVPPATVAALAAGAFIDAGAPVVLLGDSGTGKSHLLIGMGVAACEAGRRVRYVTTAALVNEHPHPLTQEVDIGAVGLAQQLQQLHLGHGHHVAPLDVLIEPFTSRTYAVATLISEPDGLLLHQPLGR